ncbi:carbonyl reductase [NADPH] 1-like [Glandiceps talaboti]
MNPRVALVTGANRGIGFAIVRALCKQFNGHVYLTSRDVMKGKQAVKALAEEGLNPKYHQLDITSQESIDSVKKYLQDTYGGLDVLVDNAGILYKINSPVPFSEQAENTLRCNFFGRYAVYESLVPIIRPHGRIVELAGRRGIKTLNLLTTELSDKFRSPPDITGADLVYLMAEYLQDVKEGEYLEKGWPDIDLRSYAISKMALIVMTSIFGRNLTNDPRDILINSCCPGRTSTRMNGFQGNISTDEAAKLPVYLALLPDYVGQPQGEFFEGMKIVSWK